MESATLFDSDRGLQLSSLQWLVDHHRAKERDRRRMVDDLQLRASDAVLDLGCGPGLWTSLLAEKVGPEGRLVGLDFSSELLAHATRSLSARETGAGAGFVLADFYRIPFADESFDVVFFGNCCSYVRDIARLLEEPKRVTKRGGRVVSKEFDGSAAIFHPLDPALNLRVVTAAAEALDEQTSDYFDNFVGRRMRGMFLRAGFRDVTTTSYAIQLAPPLTVEAKRYLRGNAEWYERTGRAYLSPEDSRAWRSAFDPDSSEYVLDREDFYFCMIEIMTVGRV